LKSWILLSGVGFCLGGWFYFRSQFLKYKAHIKNVIFKLISIPYLPWEVGFYVREFDFGL
jgi:hypothetical protein